MSPLPRLSRARVLHEGVWVGTAQVLGALGSLVGLRILTEVTTPPIYGQLALLLGVSSLGKNLFFAPPLQAALRFYPDASVGGRVARLRRLLLALIRRSASGLASVLFVVGVVWSLVSRSWVPLAWLVAVGLFVTFDAVKELEVNLLNAARRQRVFAVWTTLDAWSKPLVASLATLLLGASSVCLLFGYVLGVAGVYAILRRWRVREGQPRALRDDERWERETRSQVLQYGWPFAPLALLSWMTNLADRYFLAGISGAGAAGLYSATYALASQPFVMMGGLLALTLRPVLFDAAARGDRATTRRVFGLWLVTVCALGASGVLLLSLLGGLLVRVVLGEAFRGATSFLPWIAAAYALWCVQQGFEMLIYLRRRTKLFIVQYSVAAVSAAGFYLLLIPPLGALGAAIGTFLTFVVMCGTTIALSGAAATLLRGGDWIGPAAAAPDPTSDRGDAV